MPESHIEAKYLRRPSRRSQMEKHSWIFMRVSGVVLVALIFSHLFVNLVAGKGVSAIDFAFVAGKWASPMWQVVDCTMLWLAMIHGTNGMRLLVNDYARGPVMRRVLKSALVVAFTTVVILGTFVLTTFDPCPSGGDPSLLPSFCESVR